MTTLEKFQEVANIKFLQEPDNSDLEIGELQTADGYEIYYITAHFKNLNYAIRHLFYYRPDFDTIMAAVDDYRRRADTINVCAWDIEDWFDEYEMLNWLESEMDEESFEEFTNK